MEVTVYGSLRAATGTKTVEVEVSSPPSSIEDALEAFLEAYPAAESQLLDPQGEVRPSVRVMVDGERVELGDDCPEGAAIRLFPAMRGGSAGGTVGPGASDTASDDENPTVVG